MYIIIIIVKGDSLFKMRKLKLVEVIKIITMNFTCNLHSTDDFLSFMNND